jgi:hypothetical protein
MLWQFNSAAALVFEWGAYAKLRAQNKPIDLLYIRNGNHVSVKPGHRLVEQEMNVDWFDYWLNGRRSADPAKAAQYRRWDVIKAAPRCGDAAPLPGSSRP